MISYIGCITNYTSVYLLCVCKISKTKLVKFECEDGQCKFCYIYSTFTEINKSYVNQCFI